MEQRKRDWLEAGLELALPERFGYTCTTSAAYVGGLQADIRNCSGQHIRLSWRADGSAGPVVVNGTHRDDLATYARPGSTLHPFVALADLIKWGPNAYTDSRVYDWLAENPFKSAPEKLPATSTAGTGTPAPPSPELPAPTPEPRSGSAGEGDGRRLTREVHISHKISADYAGCDAAPHDEHSYEWWDEHGSNTACYGAWPEFEAAMFAAEDALLVAEDISPEEAARVLSEATGLTYRLQNDRRDIYAEGAPGWFVNWFKGEWLTRWHVPGSGFISDKYLMYPTLRAAVYAVLEHIGHPADRTIYAEHAEEVTTTIVRDGEEVARSVGIATIASRLTDASPMAWRWSDEEGQWLTECGWRLRRSDTHEGTDAHYAWCLMGPHVQYTMTATVDAVIENVAEFVRQDAEMDRSRIPDLWPDDLPWTLNGETTMDPDGRTLLHGAPVKESPTRTNEDTMPRAEESSAASSALSGWQEEVLGMLRRLGATDKEIVCRRDRPDAMVTWFVFDDYSFGIAPMDDGFNCNLNGAPMLPEDHPEPLESIERMIRGVLRDARARLEEVLGDD